MVYACQGSGGNPEGENLMGNTLFLGGTEPLLGVGGRYRIAFGGGTWGLLAFVAGEKKVPAVTEKQAGGVLLP